MWQITMRTHPAVPILLFSMMLCVSTPAIRAGTPDGADEGQILKQGHRWYAKGEWDKALKEYEEVLRLNPKSAEGYLGRATVRHQKGELDKAIKDYDEAIRLNPSSATAFSNRGAVWQMKGDLDKALADDTEAIRLDPEYPTALRNRGMVWRTKGEADKAIADFTSALRLDPKFVDAYVSRGLAWEDKRNYGKALYDYNDAIRLDPKCVEALANRARIRAACPDATFRDGTKAVRDAKAACEASGWKNADVLAVLAAAHAEAGQFDDAVKWQQKALDDAEYAKRNGDEGRKRLKLYEEKKPLRDE
jgi:tetratricopeptide (TPR) repeat protein